MISKKSYIEEGTSVFIVDAKNNVVKCDKYAYLSFEKMFYGQEFTINIIERYIYDICNV